ncbi:MULTISPECIES: archaetidylserine decarboxylase [Pseudoalteromonas]|uniref:Phosphatidylserine decarboxylase proenzyme n=1 Tax=Pseudoalteromonas maricaloris TaxID=184924 RepID=A0A8I2HC12_9GAMM|nr:MULTISPECIES: archaetidylserine decarboxylase [Pseudoalteromonas]MCG7539073.1 archaetidylserine decarboxylase [Pseudoalteromonas sp. OF7H-1]KID36018.1 phosphatidylserine decarboxylase [Pseudoalteromonas flavipulchra NCIMB 2033 = ATCC BAA-314]KJY94389.1 phosphatidylserine decarboxylase [Pseudoalteromonas piscicida]MBD0780185.1 phosphatidylserine decarboxylase [Pseudoalteromonas flavipulchra]MBE0371430.1 phosphatidylserine decarboxylase [Pseudoalteromonas flavipulchra NCIMB 2033 = ATCC BAA-31
MNLDKLKIAMQYALPKHAVSRLVGKLAAAEAGALTTKLIKLFIKQYKIDMSEALHEDPAHYKTFNEFFTRPLKPGIRPLAEESDILAHPVDGAISQLGDVVDGQIIQAKGHNYSLQTLLGGKEEDVAPYVGGKFATIYLAPKDYHRIHMPVDGTLRKMIYVPGDLFSVNPLTAQNVPNLFARNERVVAIFDTEIGPLSMVLVGATIVASIETIWAGTVTPPAGRDVFTWTYPAEGDNAITLKKGEEMGRFKLGSTVILAWGANKAEFLDGQNPETVTRMGTPFAKIAE